MKTAFDFALAYAAAGYKVIPVRGKIPVTARGAHDATTDAETIRAWWSKWPDANIAITLGGLVVVDIDPRNGGTVDALNPLPETAIASTGGGGLHYIYKAKGGVRYAGKLAQGVDQKTGSGAYIIVAPSSHASGKSYEWINSPLDTEPTTAPEWLATTKAPYKPSAPRAPKNSKSWVWIDDDESELPGFAAWITEGLTLYAKSDKYLAKTQWR